MDTFNTYLVDVAFSGFKLGAAAGTNRQYVLNIAAGADIGDILKLLVS